MMLEPVCVFMRLSVHYKFLELRRTRVMVDFFSSLLKCTSLVFPWGILWTVSFFLVGIKAVGPYRPLLSNEPQALPNVQQHPEGPLALCRPPDPQPHSRPVRHRGQLHLHSGCRQPVLRHPGGDMWRGLQCGGVTGEPQWRQSGLLSTQDLLRWARQHERRVQSTRGRIKIMLLSLIFRHSSLPRE